MEELIANWKTMKADLERQLALFEPPTNMHTSSDGKDTTKKSKKRVRRCIEELEELIEIHEPDRT
ncbi:hypothetical protein V3H18_10135 [Methylocystis sp. 9N]|uniref:General stress protein CsbD n=1 Tax=Methylocystis borbori TaxID=3118750 RepID=A0ABU7XI65_9HYPH